MTNWQPFYIDFMPEYVNITYISIYMPMSYYTKKKIKHISIPFSSVVHCGTNMLAYIVPIYQSRIPKKNAMSFHKKTMLFLISLCANKMLEYIKPA